MFAGQERGLCDYISEKERRTLVPEANLPLLSSFPSILQSYYKQKNDTFQLQLELL